MRGAPPPERVPVAGIDLLAALNPVALPLVAVLRSPKGVLYVR